MRAIREAGGVNVRNGWKADVQRCILRIMDDDPAPPLSWRRFKWAGQLFMADRAEAKGHYDAALEWLRRAEEIRPLGPRDRVFRAMVLLRSQRLREAHSLFASLRKEFGGATDPTRQYLRRYCTAMLGMLRLDSGPMDYEARQARSIPCSPSLRRRFPLVERQDE